MKWELNLKIDTFHHRNIYHFEVHKLVGNTSNLCFTPDR